MKNKKITKEKTLFITIIVTLLIVLVGATYAYFTQTGETGTQTDVNVRTSNQDVLTFEVGNDINIEVNQTTFASGKGNTSGTTFGKATLTTTNQDNELKASYNLYLNINENELSYTSSDNAPELLLKVTDNTGTELTSISGLDYKEVTDGLGNTVKGFDITTKTGLITILNNQEIIAKPTKIDTWNVEVILVNHNFDQSANAGKSVLAKLQMIKYEKENLAGYIKSQYTTQGVNGLYLHNGTIKSGDTVIDASDESYRYAGSNPNNYVCFGSDEETCPSDNLYRIIGVFGDRVKLIKADFATSSTLGTGGAISFGWTYTASDYENYKGSLTTINRYSWNTSTNATYTSSKSSLNKNNMIFLGKKTNERYNIIADDADYANTWSVSNLNTVNLNTNYISYLNNQNAKWTQMIAESSWKVGGNTFNNIMYSPMHLVYQNEIVNPVTTNTIDGKTGYETKIGLMYVSDYGYAASPTYWIYAGYNSSGSSKDYSSAISANWMYMGIDEWTITRGSDAPSYVFFVSDKGSVELSQSRHDVLYAVRPCFYLNSNVTYTRGSGTSSDPYRIA